MITTIENPMAIAWVSWRTADEGGRRTGRPTASVYAATCVFPLGNDADVRAGWPGQGDALSILLEVIDLPTDLSGNYKVDFLARNLAQPYLHAGANVLVMEGPTVVATAIILEVMQSDEAAW